MTIQDAIKSGKPFHRVDEQCALEKWYFVSPSGKILLESGMIMTREGVSLNASDLLANDWEIKQS